MACSTIKKSEVITIVTCEGDLFDPRFPAQFNQVIERLNETLGNKVKVHKLEPWNSVRVTLSIPREAALRLRHLASEASQELRALGILSVQVEGDQVISLRLANSVNSEPQEIILDTTQDGSSSGEASVREETGIALPSPTTVAQSTASDSNNAQLQFKSPNVVCPSDSVVPRVNASSTTPSVVISASNKLFSGPFPFTSMNQAIHGGNRESSNFNSLPPPYPGKHPPVTISSPLLVNLLQNDGTKESNSLKGSQPPLRVIRTPPTTTQKVFMSTASSPTTTTSFTKPNKSTSPQADVVVSNSISPSALSTPNFSMRKHGNPTLLTSTSNKTAVKSPPHMPPQYHRGIVTAMVAKPSVANPLVKAHTPTFLESQTQSTSSFSQIVTPSNNISAQPITPQATVQRQNVPELQQPQHFTATPMNRVPLTDTSGVAATSKLFQKNLSLPQVKTPPLTSLPTARNPFVMALPPRRIFNMSSNSTSNLSTTRMPSPQIEPSQSNDASYIFQQLKTTKNNFIQTPPTICPQVATAPGPLSSSTTALPNTDTLNLNASNLNSVMLRSMPSPPPYSVAISRTWDSSVNSNALMDLTPSLTDLKPDELEELLPTLELTESPLPDLPDEFLNVNSNMSATDEAKLSPVEKRKFLINPLTGEMELQPSDESDHEEMQDVFTGLRSPAALSDDDTCSTSRFDPATDQSDNEARTADKIPKLKNSSKDRGRDSPSLKQEKIKLRLKLEKSEPINPAYKVDVSYINSHSKKATMVSSTSEELRVPPLHISLRGRNSVVIKNKNKFSPDASLQKPKVKKNQEHSRIKKSDPSISLSKSDELFEGISNSSIPDNPVIDQVKMKMHVDQKKTKKMKTDQEQMDIITNLAQDSELKSKFFVHNHFKEKQKERRGSDSDLVRNNKKYSDNAGVLFDEKKRRFSQAEQIELDQPPVVGSTNVGTITNLPQKPRKDKVKVRDVFRKETSKIKNFCKMTGDKMQNKVVSLPVAGDMNMEAKFKQGLLEGNEKTVVRQPYRTDAEAIRLETSRTTDANRSETSRTDANRSETNRPEASRPEANRLDANRPEVNRPEANRPEMSRTDTSRVEPSRTETNRTETNDKAMAAMPDTLQDSSKEKLLDPDPDKCNSVEIKSSIELVEKSTSVPGSRSPNTGGGQGEDSGIESMDALSEKSPNQASQSPYADIPKTQVPNILDIEAQLAKMEGLDRDSYRTDEHSSNIPTEDVNENKCHRDAASKLNQCCELTYVLQESLSSPLESPSKQPETNLVPTKTEKGEEDLEPVPVRITPALYTYSNPEKGRMGLESPEDMSDDDSNSCSTTSTIHSKPSKSLLEQLLIEIPNDHQSITSSPSPATRFSVRTRALSKLESPELNTTVPKNNRNVASGKRKRNESDSSNQSVEDNVKKSKKKTDAQRSDFAKTRYQNETTTNKVGNVKKTVKDESSDSDEPLIEKMKKSNPTANVQQQQQQVNNLVATKTKVKVGLDSIANNNNKGWMVNTRRSVRSNMSTQITRNKGEKIQSESDALRRKTRSTVIDVEKRKKEVK